MASFFVLWMGSIIYLVSDAIRLFTGYGSLSQFFFPVLFLSLLPVWIFVNRYIEKTTSFPLASPSLPRIMLFIVGSYVIFSYLALSIIPAIIALFTIGAVLFLIDARLLLLLTILGLSVIAVTLFIGEKYLAMSLAPYLYMTALFFTLTAFVVPYIARYVKRLTWMNYSPLEWKGYLSEMQWIIKWYIRIGVYLFPLSIVYIIFQEPTWILFLNSTVPMFLVLLFYFSFLVVPLQGEMSKPFSLKI